MTKKKKATSKKQPKKKGKIKKVCKSIEPCREKAFGDPVRAIPIGSQNDKVYPRLFRYQDSLWTKIKRFFRCIP